MWELIAVTKNPSNNRRKYKKVCKVFHHAVRKEFQVVLFVGKSAESENPEWSDMKLQIMMLNEEEALLQCRALGLEIPYIELVDGVSPIVFEAGPSPKESNWDFYRFYTRTRVYSQSSN